MKEELIEGLIKEFKFLRRDLLVLTCKVSEVEKKVAEETSLQWSHLHSIYEKLESLEKKDD